jgi:hypothetical protein
MPHPTATSRLTSTILLAALIAVPAIIHAQTPATKPASPAAKPTPAAKTAPAAKPATKPEPKEPPPSLAPIFAGQGESAAWTALGEYTITPTTPDGAHGLAAPILTAQNKRLTLTSSAPIPANSVIQGFIRFPAADGKPATADVSIGIQNPTDGKEKLTGLTLSGNPAANTVMVNTRYQGAPFVDDNARNLAKDWDTRNPTTMLYRLRAYNTVLPGWEEDFRNRVVFDMSSLPALNEKWLNFRIQTTPASTGTPGKAGTPGKIEVWLDDRLVAARSDTQINLAGHARIGLAPGTQLANVTCSPYAPANPAKFTPIPLAGYANASEFLDAKPLDWSAMPTDAANGKIDGIPFTLTGKNPEGNDHIDLGKSFLRQNTQPGYLPTRGPRLGGADQRDPARIQLRIPFANYKALHLIAASDGEPDTLPVITAQFYRPEAGFHINFEGSAPLATSTAKVDATPIATRLIGGKPVNLYRVTIPLDPGQLSALSDLDTIEVELTKKVQLWRSYPDPISYGMHPAGLPSSVHIYALTLESTPIDFAFNPDSFGHTWTSDQTPGYTATLTNQSGKPRNGKLTLTTTSFDKSQTITASAPVNLPAESIPTKVSLAIPVTLYGYHDVSATLEIAAVAGAVSGDASGGAYTWTENRSLVKLAPDTRSTRWTEGKGVLFGFWSYNGGHYTPKAENILRLMVLAGARTGIGSIRKAAAKTNDPNAKDTSTPAQNIAWQLAEKHLSPTQAGAWEVAPQNWMVPSAESLAPRTPGKPVYPSPQAIALTIPLDPQKVQTYQETVIAGLRKYRDKIDPKLMPEEIYFFPEPHISSRLSAGNIPEYWSEKPFELTEEEQKRLAVFFHTSKVVAEACRKEFPGVKIMIPWGDPGFVWPLLRAGFPKDLIDGSGIDIPGFERIPERQLHEQSIHRLYFLKKEFEKAGIPNPRLQYCEGIFVPTEPGAVDWREQMDIYHRSTLLSIAHGVTRFYSSWFAFDCTDYYGAEHYGGCGIQRRIPYCDPKPAYAAYSTMTQQLDAANFDGFVPTGSLSTYCLRFKKPDDSYVYALWTIRGKRDVIISTQGAEKSSEMSPVDTKGMYIVDSMGNSKNITLQAYTMGITIFDNRIVVPTSPSVTYFCSAKDPISKITLGAPDNSDAPQPANSKPLADLGDGSWKFTDERDLTLENNHWAMMHYPGKFEASIESDEKQGKVLQSRLLKQDAVHELMPWYNILKPSSQKPITIPGAPSHLGLWVKGNSDWGRVIYVLKDANGQTFHSIGYKDQYNCDDVHSWSQFNFDGWRYLTFELPGNEGYDNYRKNGSTWWRYSGGNKDTTPGVVALPLSLDSIIVQQRSHIIYVNDIQSVASNSVQLGKLSVLYSSPQDATDEAIRLSKLRMPMPKGEIKLGNPIADLELSGAGTPTKITKLTEPSHYYDGTRMHFHFQEVPDAAKYHLYCSPYENGSGAINMTPNGLKTGQLVAGFRPDIPLYFWIVWESKDKKLSKPSPVHKAILVDNFKEK